MAFPYFNPSADVAVQNGQGYFRLKQTLASAGDIFEVPQGAHAFALGPDSDVSQATIGYIDQLSRPWYSSQAAPTQTNLSTFAITPQRAFTGFVSAVNADVQYVPSGVPGRVLIWPTEVYDATFLPDGYNPATHGLIREPPVIDIIQYFSPPQTLMSPRSDKTYYYDTLPFRATTIPVCYVMIPYYGRRYASIQVMNTSTDEDSMINVAVSGIVFRQSEGFPSVTALPVQTEFANIDQDNTRSFVIGTGFNRVVYPTFDATNAAPSLADYNAGLFDYLVLRIAENVNDQPTSAMLRVIVSDIVGRTGV